MKLLLRCALLVGFCSAPVICFGKNIVLSGAMSNGALQRAINPTVACDGLLNLNYGNGGINALHGILSPDAIETNPLGATIGPDGKAIVVGNVQFINTSGGYDYCFFIARFLANGQPDTDFGKGSPYCYTPGAICITLPLAGGDAARNSSHPVIDDGRAAVVLPNGDIIAVADSVRDYFSPDYGEVGPACVAVLKFKAEYGELDTTFGATSPYSAIPGTVYIPAPIGDETASFATGDIPFGVALQADQKIVITGSTTPGLILMFVARLLPNGLLDDSFAKDNPNSHLPGTAFVPGNIAPDASYDQASGVVILTDNRIVLGGFSALTQDAGSDYSYGGGSFALAAFTKDGLTDESFGIGNPYSILPGTVYVPYPIADVSGDVVTDTAWSLALQYDEKLVLGGLSMGGDFSHDTGTGHFAVARFTPTGLLDETFGLGTPFSTRLGTIYIPSPICGGTGTIQYRDQINSIAQQADGKLVFVGQTGNLSPKTAFAVARVTPTGVLDTTFAFNNPNSVVPGTVFIPFSLSEPSVPAFQDIPYAVRVLSNGDLTLAGDSSSTCVVAQFYNPMTHTAYQEAYTSEGAGLNC